MKKTFLSIVGIISVLSFLSLPCEANGLNFTKDKSTTPMTQFGRYKAETLPGSEDLPGNKGLVIILVIAALGLAGGGAFLYMKNKAASKTDGEFDDLDTDD
jgi:hypothetical protein